MMLEQMDINMQKNEVQPSYIKIKSKLIIDLNIRAKTIKISEENIGMNTHDLRYDTKITSVSD